jgi:ABC-type phosphate transport system ATPase subunit
MRYTLVVVSHSLGQAHRLAEQVFVLSEGRRIESLEPAVFRDMDLMLAKLDELV